MILLPAIHGALLGTVVGDALGLPYEALSRRRAARLLGPPDRHRFLLGRGMMSDDGEHACMVAQALAASAGEPDAFARDLARRLRWWLLGLPAGAGRATATAAVRLWLGASPARSGVFSAGNGPAMRSALLGAAVEDPARLAALVEASTRLTHSDPKALFGATAVAVAARAAAEGAHADYLPRIRTALPDPRAAELADLLARAAQSAAAGDDTAAFAASIGASRGVSGYIYQTVPVAIHAWLRHPRDYAAAVRAAIACGGDTDTVAAVTGGIVGAAVGAGGIPEPWRRGLLEWPRSPRWIERLAGCAHDALASRRPVAPPRVGPLVTLRNLAFLGVVLAHLARRALPPY